EQVAGTGPFVPASRLTRLRLRTRAAGAAERLPDGRVGVAKPSCERARSVARAAPLGADPGLRGPAQQPRRTARPARAGEQAVERPPPLRARLAPAPPPGAGRRGRDAMASRRLSDRTASLDRLHQSEAAGQSELRVTVQLLPSPPSSRGLWRDP